MLHSFADTEISQFEDSVFVDEDVLGFDVAVNDFVGVEILDTLDQLDEPVHDELLLQEFVVLLELPDVHREVSV
jgi:hypothetical protein